VELLQQVHNPHSSAQRSDSLTEADDDLAIAGVPQRIASKRVQSELPGQSFFFGAYSVLCCSLGMCTRDFFDSFGFPCYLHID